MGAEKFNASHPELGSGVLVASLQNIGFTSYDRELFNNLDINLVSGETVAVTGKSGSGKSVLLKIIAGLEKPHAGKIYINPKATTIYIPQELRDINVNTSLTIRNLLKNSRGLTVIEDELRHYESLISTPKPSQNNLEHYGETLELYQKLGGYTSDSDIEKVLNGLGIDRKISLDRRLGEVSSGQLRKVLIAMALYSRANLILLDDPSSHLDVKSVSWLGGYLRNSNSAIVFSSNNSNLIDKCATKTIGLTDLGRTFVFDGGYTEFVKKRDAVLGSERIEAQQVAGKLEQLRKTDAMFRSKQAYKRSSDMAQVGRALASRMERVEKQYNNMPGSKQVYREEKIKNLIFSAEKRSGNAVLSIKAVTKSYGKEKAVDLSKTDPIFIRQGEKWLVWGPNGSGKSTLINMIVDTIRGRGFLPDSGQISIGAGVSLGYYRPDADLLQKSGTLVESLSDFLTDKNMGKASSVLRFFGFSDVSIYNQDILTLNSGEKKRFALAILMLQRPNLLILDEPTGDYLSDEIKTRLAHALAKYDGTLILISHDQDFIRKINFDRELHMPQGKIVVKS